MEGSPQRKSPKLEFGSFPSELSTIQADAHPSLPLAPEKPDVEKISELKEKLLETGGMTIEPIQGDPFVLSHEHKGTGRGATLYHPDGSITEMSIEEYKAKLTEERRAASFFRPKTQMPSVKKRSSWFKNVITSLWSKFLKSWN